MAKEKSEYSKKLLDPRWQKKRLEILSRDGFACQSCGETEKTLHVHHKVYSKSDPWDIHNDYLITLCCDCHEEESSFIKESFASLEAAIKMKFLSGDMNLLAFAIHNIQMVHMREVVFSALHWALMDETFMRKMVDAYLESLKKKDKNNG